MIERLSVKDFILVDSLTLEFSSGLNVLTGETGAGKSILVGALSILFGAKGGTDLVRSGAEEAVVAGAFVVDGHAAGLAWLSDHGIETEDGSVLIRRTIKSTGRGAIQVGAVPVTRGELEEFTGLLLDLHSQHEHQSLFSEQQHRRILDRFAGIDADVDVFHADFTRLSELQERFRDLEEKAHERNREIEMLRFSIEEIDAAAIEEGEIERLEGERDRMAQFERLADHIRAIGEILDGGEYGVLSQLKRVRQDFGAVTRIDSALEAEANRLESAYYELEDIEQNIADYRDTMQYDPARLEEIEDRLAIIRRLARKYGDTEAEIVAYRNNAQDTLDELYSVDENRDSMREEIVRLERSITEQAKTLHRARTAAAETLTAQIEAVLRELAMGQARFVVRTETKTNERGRLVCGAYGADKVRFLISTNRGIDPQPLVKVASGGELSRVMLAIKTIVASVDEVRALVFDEIDTGIGGNVALSIASHMRKLADKNQVIAITHLATIAVHADNHIVVEKSVESGRTRISGRRVNHDERVKEIARMLAGEQDESTGVEHARALLERYQRVSDGQNK